MIAYQKPLDLTGLMERFRYSSSIEPRDKIYILCGLLPKAVLWAQRKIQKPIPDYNKPVEQIYVEAVSF
jgi:hypothetical protein